MLLLKTRPKNFKKKKKKKSNFRSSLGGLEHSETNKIIILIIIITIKKHWKFLVTFSKGALKFESSLISSKFQQSTPQSSLSLIRFKFQIQFHLFPIRRVFKATPIQFCGSSIFFFLKFIFFLIFLQF